MTNEKKGYISLHRQIADHWLYPDRREFTDMEAWIDLLLSVNHSEQKLRIKNRLLTCSPGQTLRSIQNWATRWRWTKPRTYRFLQILADEEMIFIENEGVTSRITILNWTKYQHSD